MRRFLEYPRFTGPTRVLLLETEYFFDASWRRAAESLGWGVASVRSAMTGGLSREDLRSLFTSIAEFKPHFVLTSNYAGMDVGGIFARFFEDARIPYVSWFTDTPRMILYGREMYVSEYSVAATWERAYTAHFKALGFKHVPFMPLATDPDLFKGDAADSFDRNLAFVGTSMIEQAHEALEKHAHLPQVVEAVARAFSEGRVTRDRFSQGIAQIISAEVLEPLNASELRNLELLINYEATRRLREELVLALAPQGIEVRGDPLWRGVYGKVDGPVGYYDDLATFYRRTAVNVNTTSLQMRSAVNQRVFDCPAAGGFLLTDKQNDLDEFFDEGEMIRYETIEDLRGKAAWYLQHPEERRKIILRGQKRVLAAHTHAHRLGALESYLKAHFGE